MKIIKTMLLVTVASSGLFTVADFAFAQAWTQTSAPGTDWRCVASSADGSRLIAAGGNWRYYTSTNSGIDWITNIEPQVGTTYGSWSVIAASADGTKYVAAIANAIWVSTNSGTTWLSNSVPGTFFFGGAALSADGSKLVAVAGGNGPSPSGIYTSTDAGVTWTQTTAPTNMWTAVASCADGSRLIAVASSVGATTNGNVIYLSTNSGASWLLADAPTNIPWSSVASSADGSKLVAASLAAFIPGHGAMSGSVYTSTNSGMNWISNNLPSAPWQAVASSADGDKLVALAQNAPIYTSINSGAAWGSNNVPNPVWYSVASSADGCKLAAASVSGINGIGPGSIYTLQTVPTPQLNIANSDLTVSWIIPSADFRLQQSPDLSSWTDLTGPPMLNFTNLQNQVVLSPSNTSSFYRLKTP